RPTNFVNSGRLSATIAGKDLDAPGIAQVSVFNPAPGGGASSGTSFKIIPGLRSSNPVQDAVNNRLQIVPGSWVSVSGNNFSSLSKDWSDLDFSHGLPTSVASVQVLVNGSVAPVWTVYPDQVNFQAPANSREIATAQVVVNGVASDTATTAVVSSSPGLCN